MSSFEWPPGRGGGGGGGGGTPAGDTGEVQYNDNGSFGASPLFYWDITNSRLGIGNGAPAYPLHVSNDFAAVPSIVASLVQEDFGDIPVDTAALIYQPLVPTSAAGPGYNDGISGTYTAHGQTFTATVYGLGDLNLVNPGPGLPLTFTDTRNDGSTFGINWPWNTTTKSDGSALTGYIIQITDPFTSITTSYTISGGSTSQYEDANLGGAVSIQIFPTSFVATGQTLHYTIYKVLDFQSTDHYKVGTPNTVTDVVNNGSYFLISHTISNTGGGRWKLLSTDNNMSDHGGNDAVHYQLAPYSESGTVTPTHYGYLSDGSNLNIAYRAYGTNGANFSSTYDTDSVTDPNDGLYYYVSISQNISNAKFIRNVNGAGFNEGQTSTSTPFTDWLQQAWASGTAVTPVAPIIETAYFSNGETTFGLSGKAQLVLNSNATFGIPKLELRNNDNFVAAMSYNPGGGNPVLESSSGAWDFLSSNGASRYVRLGNINVFNLDNSSAIDFQVKTTTKNQAIFVNSANDSVAFNADKLGLYAATPITQPANTVAINDVLVNLGARATGGTSNFSTTIKPRTGGTAAGSEPLQFTSASLLTTATAGTLEFLTDKYYGTITTGTARKELTLNDAALTSGRVPFVTTNGRLTDDSDMSFATDTLTVTKIAATTFTGNPTLNDAVNIPVGTSTGTKIGTSASQKLGFFNATPVVQQTAVTAAVALQNLGLGTSLTASGTVSSVALSVPATSIFGVTGSPVTGSGTLGLTTTGTSGGIPYFSSTSALSSSALLAANQLVLGGGAATTPATLGSLGTTTTLLHGNAAGAPTFGAVSLTADVSGTLPVANGGTALTSGTSGGVLAYTAAGTLASSAALAANQLVLGGGAGAVPATIGSLGTTTTLLHGNAAGAPTFGAVSLTADVSGVLPEANGGTNQSTYTQGDILYASAANTLSKLAKNTTATRYLSNTGSSNNPAWAQVDVTSGITGTTPVANGGTGLTSGTSGGVLAYTASGTLASSAALTASAIVLGGGAGAAPTVLGSLGTTTTVLHGNAAGAPTYGAIVNADITNATIDLTTKVTGVLPIANSTISTQAISASAIDWSTGSFFTKTLSANTTFTFSNRTSGQTISVRLTNTASNYTVTWPTVKWVGASAPTMTVGAKSDVYTFIYDGTDVFGSAVQNMS